MTSMLRASTLATLTATFLSFASSQGAFADGRGDWAGYAWQQISIADCAAIGPVLQCPAYHEKWDWKRNQWVDIVITIDLNDGSLRLAQRLTDNDPDDGDFVCVTALAVDAAGVNIVAHHQNWYISAGKVQEQSFLYSSGALDEIAAIHIGSKQCREGGHQDDALYAHVLAGIQS